MLVYISSSGEGYNKSNKGNMIMANETIGEEIYHEEVDSLSPVEIRDEWPMADVIDEAIEKGFEEEGVNVAPETPQIPENMDELIALYIREQFRKFKDSNIEGNFQVDITATAHSGGREIPVSFKITVGPWDNQASFKSNSLVTSYHKAELRYREQKANEIKALPLYD
jgi:hypothetical protein